MRATSTLEHQSRGPRALDWRLRVPVAIMTEGKGDFEVKNDGRNARVHAIFCVTKRHERAVKVLTFAVCE